MISYYFYNERRYAEGYLFEVFQLAITAYSLFALHNIGIGLIMVFLINLPFIVYTVKRNLKNETKMS